MKSNGGKWEEPAAMFKWHIWKGHAYVPKQAENILLVAHCRCHEFGFVPIFMDVVVRFCNLRKSQNDDHFNLAGNFKVAIIPALVSTKFGQYGRSRV